MDIFSFYKGNFIVHSGWLKRKKNNEQNRIVVHDPAISLGKEPFFEENSNQDQPFQDTFNEAEKFARNLVEASDSEQEMRKISESRTEKFLGIFDMNSENAQVPDPLKTVTSDSSLPLTVASSILGLSFADLPQDSLPNVQIDSAIKKVKNTTSIELLSDTSSTNATALRQLESSLHCKQGSEIPQVSVLAPVANQEGAKAAFTPHYPRVYNQVVTSGNQTPQRPVASRTFSKKSNEGIGMHNENYSISTK